jgi:hypothetical protein
MKNILFPGFKKYFEYFFPFFVRFHFKVGKNCRHELSKDFSKKLIWVSKDEEFDADFEFVGKLIKFLLTKSSA